MFVLYWYLKGRGRPLAMHEAKKKHKKSRKRSNRWPLVIALLLVAGGGMFYLLRDKPDSQNNEQIVVQQNIPEIVVKKGTLKNFTGQQFRDLYNTFAYPNTQLIDQDQPITGNVAADEHIREIAEKRGYRVRSAPVNDTFRDVGDKMLLQERASEPWIAMKKAALDSGFKLSLNDAYRSADDQKEIFLSRMSGLGIQIPAIASGRYDTQLNELLSMTAPPSYSRHHSGYTIDLACDNQPTMAFEFTGCFQWLSDENYKNAKTHGWIPSYPEEINEQGPEPESWEYVWVGLDALTD